MRDINDFLFVFPCFRRYEALLDSDTQLLQTVQMAIRWAAVRLDSLAALNAGVVAVIIILWRDHMSNSVMGFVLYIVSSVSSFFSFSFR